MSLHTSSLSSLIPVIPIQADKGALDLAAGLARVREALAKNAKEVTHVIGSILNPTL